MIVKKKLTYQVVVPCHGLCRQLKTLGPRHRRALVLTLLPALEGRAVLLELVAPVGVRALEKKKQQTFEKFLFLKK